VWSAKCARGAGYRHGRAGPTPSAPGLRRRGTAAGLPPIRLHDVRNSYATAALRAGVPVKVVSERLGHSSVAFTQDTYMHVIPGMDEHSARVAATAILGPPGGAVGQRRDHGRDHQGVHALCLIGRTCERPLTVVVSGPLGVCSGGRIRTYDLWL
jgi:hypothetical protein